MGWMDFRTSCDCEETSPIAPTMAPSSRACPTTPKARVKTTPTDDMECHAVAAGGDSASIQAGTVCMQVGRGQTLIATFQAEFNWTLLRNQLFVGQGEHKSLETMPKKGGPGRPDTRKFKNYVCDWEGEKR
jgi:hypothetical protein